MDIDVFSYVAADGLSGARSPSTKLATRAYIEQTIKCKVVEESRRTVDERLVAGRVAVLEAGSDKAKQLKRLYGSGSSEFSPDSDFRRHPLYPLANMEPRLVEAHEQPDGRVEFKINALGIMAVRQLLD
ncbi:MAG TPA: hypothetical protein VGF97_05290 [Rhizomicrobium sp.]|jgi:hypothetical protein